jgi:hypothetical protein
MEQNCKKCKNWAEWSAFVGAAACLATSSAHTLGDMSCLRWEPKEVEIPSALDNWTPVWHPRESGDPLDAWFIINPVCGKRRLYSPGGFWTELP